MAVCKIDGYLQSLVGNFLYVISLYKIPGNYVRILIKKVDHNFFNTRNQFTSNQNKNTKKEVIQEKFSYIKRRILSDNYKIEKVCAKYLGSHDPWLPVQPVKNVQHYYIDNDKKRGYCLNAKVKILSYISFFFELFSKDWNRL